MHTLPERAVVGEFDLRLHVLKSGARRKVGNNSPLRLDDPHELWIVMHGVVNVFAVQQATNGHGPREFLFRVEPGDLLFGFPACTNAPGVSLVAVGDAETVVAAVSNAELHEAFAVAPAYATSLLDRYASTLADALDVRVEAHHPAHAWADWLPALQMQCVLAAGSLLVQRDAAVLARLDQRRARDEFATTRAFSVMGSLLSPSTSGHLSGVLSALDDALHVVGEEIGVKFRRRVSEPAIGDLAEHARQIASVSGVGCRQVRLQERWWRGDAGALLAFTKRGAAEGANGAMSPQMPVVLLPGTHGYVMVQPGSNERVPVTAELASTLAPFALQFYRSFPAHTSGTSAVRDFILHGLRAELPTIVKASIAAAAVSLVPAFLTRSLFDWVVPSADVRALATVLIALLVASIAGLLFEFVRAIAVTRARTRLIHDLQLAVMDRLFRLPVSFFRKFAAGDLGKRAIGVGTLGKDVGQYAVTAVFSAVAGTSALFLLFWYSVPLALLTCVVLGAHVGATVLAARAALPLARTKQEATGELSAFLLETLRGMAKLRVAAAEARVMSRWSEPFTRQQQAAFAYGMRNAHLTAFLAALDVIARIALFAAFASMWKDGSAALSTGAFVAFASAEGTLRTAVTTATSTLMTVLEQVPAWERLQPILHAIPESRADMPDPGVLEGNIQLRKVSFAYGTDAPPVLHNVSLDIPSGRFVAIVGPSGSGKSTLLRLLLGFEEPTSGSVLYDGKDLRLIDRIAVRRQIGVVLQNATLSNGDIYSNITGSTPRPQAAVWEAARLAGIEDEIAAMPMQLLTLVPDGGSSLSGGQRQRLLIARALINRPKMLFLDEATSALDTRAQRHVSESIDTLQVTRVVIAHRLSTIRHADQIIVLENGRIVDTGTYDELVARGGLFARLAARQET